MTVDWASLGDRLNIAREHKSAEPDLPLAQESCDFPAGSQEKIECMRLRVEQGFSIFHPQDNRRVLVRKAHSAQESSHQHANELLSKSCDSQETIAEIAGSLKA
jgi:hypothetical protein